MFQSPENLGKGGALGLGAIMLWGVSIPLARIASEDLGPMTTAAIAQTLGGTLLYCFSSKKTIQQTLSVKSNVLQACFAGYIIFFYLAIALAPSRQATMTVSLINYLWPSLSVVGIAILGQEETQKKTLILGLVFSLAGLITLLPPETWQGVLLAKARGTLSFVLAGIGAVLWACYSSLTARWSSQVSSNVPIYMITTGLILILMRSLFAESSQISVNAVLASAILAFTTSAAYQFWGYAMRGTSKLFVASSANSLPLLSVLLISAILKTSLSWTVLTAALLIVAGSSFTKCSMKLK
jgi:drug/metabolite transporter (DMT)-like permease